MGRVCKQPETPGGVWGNSTLGASGDQVIQESSSPLERGTVRAAQAGRSGSKGVITRPLQNKAVAPHPSVPPELQEQGGWSRICLQLAEPLGLQTRPWCHPTFHWPHCQNHLCPYIPALLHPQAWLSLWETQLHQPRRRQQVPPKSKMHICLPCAAPTHSVTFSRLSTLLPGQIHLMKITALGSPQVGKPTSWEDQCISTSPKVSPGWI